MTRKEEREQAARLYSPNNAHHTADTFEYGAEWADENPDERMIAKYLHEKKGYPIDLNGNLPSFEETMKDTEQYIKYKEKKLIDKACEWLKKNLKNYSSNALGEEYLIDDFKETMKGE